MAPELLLRKLNTLRQVLVDLALFREATLAQVQAEHYQVERLFELLVVVTGDVLQHLLAEQDIVPGS